MKTTLVIPDLHGKDVWRGVTEKPHDEIVFVGDYFDSFDISAADQITNFKELVNFQRHHTKPVILLIGNHDLHYMGGERCSGYQAGYAYAFKALLETAELQMAYQVGDTLITHAGVTKTWLKKWAEDDMYIRLMAEEFGEKVASTPDYATEINEIWRVRGVKAFEFQDGYHTNPYGDNTFQSPVWVRPNSLAADAVDNVHQVVGHTRGDGIRTITADNGRTITLTDCLDTIQPDETYYHTITTP